MEKRLYLVATTFFFLFLLIIFRLFYWQVIKAESLKGYAQSQLHQSQIIKANRGNIYAADKSPLVINQLAYQIYAEPDKINDKQKTSQILASLLDIDEATISAKITNDRLKWISIAEKVDKDKADEIAKLNLKGIELNQDYKRYYPEASMAAHLLGFVGKNQNGEDQGYFGIEGYYDEQLKGRNGILRLEKDALGNPIVSGDRQDIPKEDGRDLYLTIDKTVQFIVEEKLRIALEKYGATAGTVIVMDTFSGAIYAMASLPAYNPKDREKYNLDLYKNPAISSSFEPGSTFKVMVMAAAINEGSITINDQYNEVGPIEIDKYTIKTWNQQYHGAIKIPEIIQYSSNVGMVYVSEKLGKTKMFKYLKDYGLGKLTEIDVQDEVTPQLRHENKWHNIDFATTSFGQGVALTPLQMIRMVAAIANGGNLVRPYVIDKIIAANGVVIKINPKIEKTILDKDTALIVTQMMIQAVELGETRNLRPPGVRIAGKTGTAQIPISGHYDTEKTIASFVGFFPIEHPKFIMLITLREPTSSPWGSETAAPLFFEIVKDLIAYYNIPSTF